LRIYLTLRRLHPVRERVRRVVFKHRHRVLHDDGPVVVFRIDRYSLRPPPPSTSWMPDAERDYAPIT
jgi:hypothetical protein